MTSSSDSERRLIWHGALFLVLSLYPFPAIADSVSYPVSGVFLPVDPEFPNAGFEVCLLVRTLGIEAVRKNSVAQLVIFDKEKRHDLKGDVQTETTIKRIIKLFDGTHQIIETFTNSRGWIGIRRKTEYEMKVLDQNTIEIFDGKRFARYVKCVASRKLPI